MIKTLNNILKQDKEILKIPKTILDCIPIEEIYDDGIFLLSKNKYSKSYLSILLLFIVILVVAPVSKEFNKSE